jgi:hypothetical protein
VGWPRATARGVPVPGASARMAPCGCGASGPSPRTPPRVGHLGPRRVGPPGGGASAAAAARRCARGGVRPGLPQPRRPRRPAPRESAPPPPPDARPARAGCPERVPGGRDMHPNNGARGGCPRPTTTAPRARAGLDTTDWAAAAPVAVPPAPSRACSLADRAPGHGRPRRQRARSNRGESEPGESPAPEDPVRVGHGSDATGQTGPARVARRSERPAWPQVRTSLPSPQPPCRGRQNNRVVSVFCTKTHKAQRSFRSPVLPQPRLKTGRSVQATVGDSVFSLPSYFSRMLSANVDCDDSTPTLKILPAH